MPLLLLFILVPLLEIYLLLKVGSIIGAFPTIMLVILTAIIGTFLLKQQGLATLQRYQKSVQSGKIPAQELIEGLALAFGGALLLTPGFFTDAIGFLCLIPFTRQGIIRYFLKRAKFQFLSSSSSTVFRDTPHDPRDHSSAGGRTIDGDYSVKDSDRDSLP